jgi:hypothetical protein
MTSRNLRTRRGKRAIVAVVAPEEGVDHEAEEGEEVASEVVVEVEEGSK